MRDETWPHEALGGAKPQRDFVVGFRHSSGCVDEVTHGSFLLAGQDGRVAAEVSPDRAGHGLNWKRGSYELAYDLNRAMTIEHESAHRPTGQVVHQPCFDSMTDFSQIVSAKGVHRIQSHILVIAERFTTDTCEPFISFGVMPLHQFRTGQEDSALENPHSDPFKSDDDFSGQAARKGIWLENDERVFDRCRLV